MATFKVSVFLRFLAENVQESQKPASRAQTCVLIGRENNFPSLEMLKLLKVKWLMMVVLLIFSAIKCNIIYVF